MALNNYFTLTTTTLGTKRFRASFIPGQTTAHGYQRLRRIDYACDGSVLVTMAPVGQKVHLLGVMFRGDEVGSWGTKNELLAYYNTSETITFQDFDTSVASYPVCFSNPDMSNPNWFDPYETHGIVPIELLEVT